jgi:hypothetical protein
MRVSTMKSQATSRRPLRFARMKARSRIRQKARLKRIFIEVDPIVGAILENYTVLESAVCWAMLMKRGRSRARSAHAEALLEKGSDPYSQITPTR